MIMEERRQDEMKAGRGDSAYTRDGYGCVTVVKDIPCISELTYALDEKLGNWRGEFRLRLFSLKAEKFYQIANEDDVFMSH